MLETVKLGRELVPALSEKDVINSFSGMLANNNQADNGDFYIAPSEHAPGMIHVLVGAPGLTAAPGIADHVVRLLRDQGMMKEEKRSFQKNRVGWPRFESASLLEKLRIITQNPKYGHVLCRCEHVTEGEIIEAVRRGADTMDGIKHLTRAGMGRCQGSFCGTPVLNCLVKELGVAPTWVTKKGVGSHQIVGYTKEAAMVQGSGEC